MRTQPRLSVFSSTPIGLAALLCLVPLARAEAGETITTTAHFSKSGGGEATAAVTVVLDRLSSDAERNTLLATLKQGGSAGVHALLLTWSPIGAVRVGTTDTVVKYAYSRMIGDGRLITAVTGSPILFVGAGLPGAKPKPGFDLGLVLLSLMAPGPGHGELAPAAKVRLDQSGAVVVDDYGADVLPLSNVVGK